MTFATTYHVHQNFCLCFTLCLFLLYTVFKPSFNEKNSLAISHPSPCRNAWIITLLSFFDCTVWIKSSFLQEILLGLSEEYQMVMLSCIQKCSFFVKKNSAVWIIDISSWIRLCYKFLCEKGQNFTRCFSFSKWAQWRRGCVFFHQCSFRMFMTTFYSFDFLLMRNTLVVPTLEPSSIIAPFIWSSGNGTQAK